MAEANDDQMQRFFNERIRVRAEEFRSLIASFADDKASIESVFARAAGSNPWTDARTDGPPTLAASQDMLVYNSIATLLAKFVAGTATAQDSADFSANLNQFQAMCVRPV